VIKQFEGWSTARIPLQIGRLAVITGAAEGVGAAIALGLAQAGADVVIADENDVDGRLAASAIRRAAPAAIVRLEKLDVGSLDSVADFAARMVKFGRPIDLLINGATVRQSANRTLTPDGVELHLAANYLSHFALTGLLLPLLSRGRYPRVVQLSSLAYRSGTIDFDDLQQERDYTPWKAYSQSKLAMLMFAMELQRRNDKLGWGILSAAAHPGYLRTEPLGNGLSPRSLMRKLRGSLELLVSHSTGAAALPALLAATSPAVRRAGFYGPTGPFELAGPPGELQVAKKARDAAAARRLWEISEELTRIKWPDE
jgi:NAD(P)-dependent dehydrogenase (short-subunit alcohol dehydrogenase family)